MSALVERLARELKPIGAVGAAVAKVLRRPEVKESLDGLAMDVCVIDNEWFNIPTGGAS